MIRRAAGVLVAWTVAACVAHADATVGAYYYPWYGPTIGGHHYNDVMRMHLEPDAQPPLLGEYSSRDPNVIAAHIDQSHLANISMWSMSWWGPNGFEDRTIRNNIFTHPRASELQYTVHYESAGRLGSFASPNYANLMTDFQYLGTNIFSDPNYMRIDDRPVIFMYLSREYFKTQAGWDALANVRTMMETNFGYDPYIIGDHFFVNMAPGAQYLDAVTSFDVYGQVFNGRSTSITQVNKLAQIYTTTQTQANAAGVDFIPAVAPGYNDRAVRDGNTASPRYIEGTGYGPSTQGSTLAEIMNRAALTHLDSDVDNLIMVNSFNEWHEDTQIEPTIIAPVTTVDDTATGVGYTQGKSYEGYGNRYLDILRELTRDPVPGDFNNNGRVDGFDLTGAGGWNERFGDDLDGQDLLAWQANLGFSLWPGPGPSAEAAFQSTPEPAAATLTLFALGGAWAARRRRRMTRTATH